MKEMHKSGQAPGQAAVQSIDEARWQAVLDRDGRIGGFVYGVTSTGIYCRPGCPSRRPRRDNVVFFDTPAQAEDGGFRPCARCRPGPGPSPEEERASMVLAACRSLEDNVEEGGLTLAALAEAAGLSPFHFQRLFKRVLGVTPKAYQDACRARKLRDGLAQGRDVSGAIYEAGFGSASRVYERTAGLLGMSPGAYRSGGAGEHIRHAVTETSLGWLLVAATDKGVCSAELGDDPEELLARLRRRFPKADLRHAQSPFQTTGAQGESSDLGCWLRAIVAAIEQPGSPPAISPDTSSTTSQGLSPDSPSDCPAAVSQDIPLDIRGTVFQHQVWRALRDVPVGRTVSYSELAARIGRPEASRAVARACAGNTVAVVVPCHRAVGKDGSLTGYRWGLDRKRKILDRERGRETSEDPKVPEPLEPEAAPLLDWQI